MLDPSYWQINPLITMLSAASIPVALLDVLYSPGMLSGQRKVEAEAWRKEGLCNTSDTEMWSFSKGSVAFEKVGLLRLLILWRLQIGI